MLLMSGSIEKFNNSAFVEKRVQEIRNFFDAADSRYSVILFLLLLPLAAIVWVGLRFFRVSIYENYKHNLVLMLGFNGLFRSYFIAITKKEGE